MSLLLPVKEVRCSLWTSHIYTSQKTALLPTVGLALRMFLPLKLSQHLEDTWRKIIKLSYICIYIYIHIYLIRKRSKAKITLPNFFLRLLDNLLNLRTIFFFHFQPKNHMVKIITFYPTPLYTGSSSQEEPLLPIVVMSLYVSLDGYFHVPRKFLEN